MKMVNMNFQINFDPKRPILTVAMRKFQVVSGLGHLLTFLTIDNAANSSVSCRMVYFKLIVKHLP